MISEEQQDQAALHALGLLPADEAERLERAMDADVELRNLVRDLRDAAAALTHGLPDVAPPAALRDRVLNEIAGSKAVVAADPGHEDVRKVVPFRLPTWIPWALAASLLALCGVLGTERMRLQRDLLAARLADPLAEVALFDLATTGDRVPAAARATVAWEPASQRGILRVTGLPAPEPGKDYQLWTIGAGSPDAISAGVVHVDPSGAARIEFHTVTPVQGPPKIFAVSVEQAGGSPTHEGPLILKSGT